MHCFLLKVLKNCQNLLYDHPVTHDQKKIILLTGLLFLRQLTFLTVQ